MKRASPRWPKGNVPPGYRSKPTRRELRRLRLRPSAADDDDRQQPEANDVPAPCNKRQR
jgi:hypothetical protein